MYVLNRRMFQRGKDNKYFWFHEQSNTFFSVKTYLCCIKENSMTVNEARLIYFSPTHTSKQVAEAIVHGTGIKNVISINLTLQTVEETVIPTSALAVIVEIGRASRTPERCPVCAEAGRHVPSKNNALHISLPYIHSFLIMYFLLYLITYINDTAALVTLKYPLSFFSFHSPHLGQSYLS